MSTEILTAKVTNLGNGLYGCRIIDTTTNQWIVEAQVPKQHISGAIKDMLRTLDKICYESPMAYASRHRDKPSYTNFKYIWNR